MSKQIIKKKVSRIEPTGNYYVVQLEEAEKVTAGGIILADSAQKKPQLAVVLEAGPGMVLMSGERLPMQAKRGDIIVVHRHAPQEVELPDRSIVWWVSEGDVLGVVREEEVEVETDVPDLPAEGETTKSE